MHRSVSTPGLLLAAVLVLVGMAAEPAGEAAAGDRAAAASAPIGARFGSSSTGVPSPLTTAKAITAASASAAPPPDAAAPPIAALAPPAPAPAPDPPLSVQAPAADSAPVGDAADPCGAIQADVPIGPPQGWTVICGGPREGLKGETNPNLRVVIVYVRSSWSVREGARVLAHELGHAYDFALLTDADRTAWMQQRGLGGNWGSYCPAGTTCDDLSRPAGDWAEAVGEVLVPDTGLWACRLGGPPGESDASLLRTILASHGAAV